MARPAATRSPAHGRHNVVILAGHGRHRAAIMTTFPTPGVTWRCPVRIQVPLRGERPTTTATTSTLVTTLLAADASAEQPTFSHVSATTEPRAIATKAAAADRPRPRNWPHDVRSDGHGGRGTRPTTHRARRHGECEATTAVTTMAATATRWRPSWGSGRVDSRCPSGSLPGPGLR